MLTMIAAHAINFNCFCCHKNHLLKLRIFIISIITKLSYNFIRFNLSELVTTLTELNAIAEPATHGASKRKAAIGIPATLSPNAQNKFCLILLIVELLALIALGINNNSPPKIVTS